MLGRQLSRLADRKVRNVEPLLTSNPAQFTTRGVSFLFFKQVVLSDSAILVICLAVPQAHSLQPQIKSLYVGVCEKTAQLCAN